MLGTHTLAGFWNYKKRKLINIFLKISGFFDNIHLGNYIADFYLFSRFIINFHWFFFEIFQRIQFVIEIFNSFFGNIIAIIERSKIFIVGNIWSSTTLKCVRILISRIFCCSVKYIDPTHFQKQLVFIENCSYFFKY